MRVMKGSFEIQTGGAGTFGTLGGSPTDHAGLAAALEARVAVAGDEMTGALAIARGTAAGAGLSLTQGWNSGGTTCRGVEVAVTDTASAGDSTLLRLLGGTGGTTSLFSVSRQGVVRQGDATGHHARLDHTLTGLPALVGTYIDDDRSAVVLNDGPGLDVNLATRYGSTLFSCGSAVTNRGTLSANLLGYGVSNSQLTFTFGATKKNYNGLFTGAGHHVAVKAGMGSSEGTGASGGKTMVSGGDAAGSGDHAGGDVEISGGTPTGSGAAGVVRVLGRAVSSADGAVSAPALHVAGTIFSGGSGTTTKPQVLVEPEGTTSTGWSTAGTLLGVNGAADFEGDLLVGKADGETRFGVKHDGTVQVGSATRLQAGELSGDVNQAGALALVTHDAYGNALRASGAIQTLGRLITGLGVQSPYYGGVLHFAEAGAMLYGAANVVSVINGTNAQVLRVYRTSTDADNYERAALQTGSGYVELAAEAAGSGTDDLDLRLSPGGNGHVQINKPYVEEEDMAPTGYINIRAADGNVYSMLVRAVV